MKSILTISLMLVLAVSTWALAPGVTLTADAPNAYTIRYTCDPGWQELPSASGPVYGLTVEGWSNAHEPGQPESPHAVILLAIPAGVEPEIAWVPDAERAMHAPGPLAARVEGPQAPEPEYGIWLGQGESTFPSAGWKLTQEYDFRGLTFRAIVIYPCHPQADGSVRVIPSGRLEVHWKPTPWTFEDRKLAGWGCFWKQIANWESTPLARLPQAPQEEGTYLIEVAQTYAALIEPLRADREALGYTVIVNTVAPSATSTAIKTQIQGVYDTAVPPLVGVVLIGDTEQLPTGPDMDTYYGFLSGPPGDIVMDVPVGRISGDTNADIENQIHKVELFESPSDSDGTEWLYRAVQMIRLDHSAHADSSYLQASDTARDQLQSLGFTVGRYTNDNGNADSVLTWLDPGVQFLTFRGQSVNDWWNPFENIPARMNNGRKMPVVCSVTCGTGSFQYDGYVCENITREGTVTDPHGAVSFFGATAISSNTEERSSLMMGYFTGIGRDGVRTLGGCLLSAKAFLMSHFDPSGYGTISENSSYCQLGDPLLHLNVEIPQPMSVDYPAVVGLGPDSALIRVEGGGVPLENAVVTLRDNEVTLDQVRTDAEGNAWLHFSVLSTDTLELAVSKRGFLGFSGTVYAYSNTPYLICTSVFVEDPPPFGNWDYDIDPGEKVRITVQLNNLGRQTLQNPIASLELSDRHFLFFDSVSTLPNLAPLTPTGCDHPFSVQVHPHAPPNYPANITMRVTGTADGNPFEQIIPIPLWVASSLPVNMLPTGPDAYGMWAYEEVDTSFWQRPTYIWGDIATGGTRVTALDREDDSTFAVPLPFSFRWYGRSFDSISICTNGVLILGKSAWHGSSTIGHEQHFPNAADPNYLIAPYWTDLMLDASSAIHTYFDAMGHRFIIQFKDLAHFRMPSARERFQVVLRDPAYYPTPTGDGDAAMFYGLVTLQNDPAIGTEGDGTVGLELQYHDTLTSGTSRLTTGRAILLTTSAPAAPDGPWFVGRNVRVNDYLGNGDGIADVNEVVFLVVSVLNAGNRAATNVQVRLATESGLLMPVTSSGTIAGLAPGQLDSTGEISFLVRSHPSDTVLGFRLWIRAGSDSAAYDFALELPLAVDAASPMRSVSLRTWPEPFSAELHILGPANALIEVSDLFGRIVGSARLDETARGLWVPSVDLPAGSYFLRYQKEARRVVRLR